MFRVSAPSLREGWGWVSDFFSLVRQLCRFAFQELCFCALKGKLLSCERSPFELRLLSSLTLQRYNIGSAVYEFLPNFLRTFFFLLIISGLRGNISDIFFISTYLLEYISTAIRHIKARNTDRVSMSILFMMTRKTKLFTYALIHFRHLGF